MQVVKYNDKEYKIPFDVNLTLDAQDKLIEVENRFSGATASLPWFAVAVYDMIIGAERLEDYATMQKGLSWFSKHFPEEYYTLLD
jgi:hypothetical protein